MNTKRKSTKKMVWKPKKIKENVSHRVYADTQKDREKR